VPAGRSGRAPSRALVWLDRRRAWGGSVDQRRSQAETGERDERWGKQRLPSGVHASVTKREGEAARVSGPKDGLGWAGCKTNKRENGPDHWLGSLQIKGFNLS
jgi:hypothetical protein